MATGEDLVGAVFIAELWGIALAGLKLNGHSLAVEEVGAFKDDTERALADLLSNTVVDTDDVGAGAGVRGVRSRHWCERVVKGLGGNMGHESRGKAAEGKPVDSPERQQKMAFSWRYESWKGRSNRVDVGASQILVESSLTNPAGVRL